MKVKEELCHDVNRSTIFFIPHPIPRYYLRKWGFLHDFFW